MKSPFPLTLDRWFSLHSLRPHSRRRHLMLSRSARSLLLGAATLAACGGSAGDIEELKKGQKDILAKLDGLDKAVQQVRAQAPAAPRPAMDPAKVYSLAVGNTPVRGPKTAKVTIYEFSDFQ